MTPTYRDLAATHGTAIERLARGYEVDAERRRELVQEVHVALWRSLGSWDGRCSERDLLAGVWRWYLGPMVPGLELFFAGPARVAESAREVGVLVGSAAFGVVVRTRGRYPSS